MAALHASHDVHRHAVFVRDLEVTSNDIRRPYMAPVTGSYDMKRMLYLRNYVMPCHTWRGRCTTCFKVT